jgi:hypothetical protein
LIYTPGFSLIRQHNYGLNGCWIRPGWGIENLRNISRLARLRNLIALVILLAANRPEAVKGQLTYEKSLPGGAVDHLAGSLAILCSLLLVTSRLAGRLGLRRRFINGPSGEIHNSTRPEQDDVSNQCPGTNRSLRLSRTWFCSLVFANWSSEYGCTAGNRCSKKHECCRLCKCLFHMGKG